MDIEAFRAEAIKIADGSMRDCLVMVEEFDFGFSIGVAIEIPNGKRHAVRGNTRAYVTRPPWWKFWEKPVTVLPITPRAAVAELAKWAIINGLG